MSAEARLTFVEIRSRDLPKAARFYGSVFHWATAGDGKQAALLSAGSLDVAIVAMPDDVPLTVCPYVHTENSESTAQRAAAAGANVLFSAVDTGQGRLSLTIDPWGNHLAFWERLPPAIPSPGVSGGVFWTLLRCTDTATAVAYYQDVCGWSFQHPSAEVALTGGSQFGLSLVVGIDKPLVCVAVADLEQTCAGVREAGGQVRLDSQAAMVAHGLPRSDSPCALMTDLEGHQLALVQSF